MAVKVIQFRLASTKKAYTDMLKSAQIKSKRIKKAIETGYCVDHQLNSDTQSPMQTMIAFYFPNDSADKALNKMKLKVEALTQVEWYINNSDLCDHYTAPDPLKLSNEMAEYVLNRWEVTLKNGYDNLEITFAPDGEVLRDSSSFSMSIPIGRYTDEEMKKMMWGTVADELEILHKYNEWHGAHEPIDVIRKREEKEAAKKEALFSSAPSLGFVTSDGVVHTASVSATPTAWSNATISKTTVTSFDVTFTLSEIEKKS